MHRKFIRPARQIALVYVAVASFWILFSDRWVAGLFGNSNYLHVAHTLKGWAFVLVTGVLLYWVMKRSLQRIEVVALEDALTGLPNRLAFTSRLDERCRLGQSRGQFFYLIIVDIDNFADLNDDEGHGRGDEYLELFSQTLIEALPGAWYVGRLGGDEFGLILPINYSLESSFEALDTMQLQLERRARESLFSIYTLSAGICRFPQQGQTARELLSNADMALLNAKHKGRGLRYVYEDELRASLVKRLSLLRDLKQACEDSAFSLVFQPQWSVLHNAWVGAEVLIRWVHPDRGPVPPDEFIPLAEKEGLIGPITEFVVERSLAELKQAGITRELLPCLSINLSNRVLLNSTTMTRLFDIIDNKCETCPSIIWEITETSAMENLDATLDVMHSNRLQGVGFSIDDFGTGYSSLARLKQLPLSELKIDRSFIDELPQDMNDVVIVKAILAMAKALSLEVVAEGVETQEQADFLTQQGCTNLQGYLYARPMPVGEFKEKLLQSRLNQSLRSHSQKRE